MKSKYGLHNILVSNIINGSKLSIKSAINKTQYFKNQIYEIHGNDFEIISEYLGDSKDIYLKNKYGICKSIPSSLLQGRGIDIRSAINSVEYLINKLRNYI